MLEIKLITKNQNNNIKLSDIFLSDKNPRYTLVNLKNQDLKYYQQVDEEKLDDDKNVALTLLRQEGDLKDFLDLLNSIVNNDFKNELTDHILLVQAKKDNEVIKDKYIVMEGNRRILALKLLSGLIELPDWDYLEYSISNSTESILDNDFNDESNQIKTKDQKKENYKKIEDLITNFLKQKRNKTWKVHYDLIDNYQELIQTIYSKHVTGERVGLRRWSRSKYYADLINIFPEGINLKSKKTKIYINEFQRTENMIINDFEQAQFVYLCFYYGNYDEFMSSLDENLSKEQNLQLYRRNILKKMVEGEEGKVSALETKHSITKIKDILVKNFYINSEKEFDDKYFNFYFDKEDCYLIKINSKNKIEEKRMFKFIYTYWKKGIITTRPIKDQNSEEFKSSLLLYLLNDFKENDSLLKNQQFKKLDVWKITDKNILLTFIKNNQNSSEKKLLEQWKTRLTILVNDEILNKVKITKLSEEINWETDSAEKLKGAEPIAIFEILIRQYQSINKIYINALAATIRSLWEQVLIWTAIGYLNNPSGKKEISDLLKTNLGFNGSSKGNIYNAAKIDNFIQNLTNNVYFKNRDFLIDVIEYSTNQNSQNFNEKKQEIIVEFVEAYLQKSENETKPKNIQKLNEMIHASHRIYNLEQYKDILDTFQLMQKSLFELLCIIDFDKIWKANDKFVKEVKKIQI